MSQPPPSQPPVATNQAAAVSRYSTLFSRMILSALPRGNRLTVLDIGCGTGHPAFEVLRELHPSSRVIGIDLDPERVEVARRRAMGDAGKSAFFKVENVEELSFGDGVFDLVLGNLVLGELQDPGRALVQIRRVLAPGGRVLLTRPLSGTFIEVIDMFRELALRYDEGSLADRAEQVAQRDPTPAALQRTFRHAGFESARVEQRTERWTFRSTAETFADPVIERVALPQWRWIAGGEDGERWLQEAERSLDLYFGGGPLSLTVEAGMVDAHTA